MIDKATFRKTEKKLYNYFMKNKKINSLKHKIELLNKQVEKIEQKLKKVDVSIPEESRSMTYEERIQTSNDGTSYAERAAMRITDKLLAEQSRKIEEIADIEVEIMNIEADNVIIENNIKLLKKEDVDFLESKYGKELPDWEVGINLNMTQSTTTRKRQRLIRNVAEWEQVQKIMH